MVPKICIARECDRAAERIKHGLCLKHYDRLRRHGDPDITLRIVGDDVKRFWLKVDRRSPDECWEWLASVNDWGYGQFRFRGKTVGAHVFSLESATGSRRPEGNDTCHTCDNRKCVNPSHLYWGTRQQNMDDAWDRNRMPVGEHRAAAKVSERDIVAIREQYADGAEVEFLVDAYGLKNSTIRGIVLGYKWKHAGGPITRRRIYKEKKVA